TVIALSWSPYQTRAAFASPHPVGGTVSGDTNAPCWTTPVAAASSATKWRSNHDSGCSIRSLSSPSAGRSAADTGICVAGLGEGHQAEPFLRRVRAVHNYRSALA